MTDDPAVFGYGSLVNLATHDFAAPRAARLTGWRRIWRHSTQRQVAFLSVEPDPNSSISGVIAHLPGGDWAALDVREHAYTRRDVTHQVTHISTPIPTAVYEARPELTQHPSVGHPILLSYLDVVIQGFLQIYGQEGVDDFIATTHDWGPILNDRTAPIYPRAQTLSAQEIRIVDRTLEQLPVPMQHR